MRLSTLTTACALVLAAGPALAQDDSAVPGMKRNGPGFGRPTEEIPELKPFLPAPRAAAPATDTATPAAMPEPMRPAALDDVDRLLRRAEADAARHRIRDADNALEQAETEMLNARASGETVPQQAIEPVEQARAALQHKDYAGAERAIAGAESAVRPR